MLMKRLWICLLNGKPQTSATRRKATAKNAWRKFKRKSHRNICSGRLVIFFRELTMNKPFKGWKKPPA